MAMTWTDDQRTGHRVRNRNLLVAAAAGSGKTAVLVERIIRMVTDKDDPVGLDRLLVMTFTNAAAAEMRERIGAAVERSVCWTRTMTIYSSRPRSFPRPPSPPSTAFA